MLADPIDPKSPVSERAIVLPDLARFRVVRRLGEGGAGLVYEAIDREHGGRVALKTLRTTNAEQLLRLKEEFRALQDIEHRNLIRLFELICDDDTWFFTMEIVDGVDFVAHVKGPADGSTVVLVDHSMRPAEATDDLRSVTRAGDITGSIRPRVRRFDEARLRSGLMQLASGLTALHAAGKTHCDIKPSNVLVAGDGRVVILDFGLVRDAARASGLDDGAIVGTIPYMAPEQAVAEEVGPAADWYGVGAMLYQCLTGRRPFEGPGVDVVRRKLEEDPARPKTLARAVPDDLDALCMDLLEREPTRRPTGLEVLQRLEQRSKIRRPREVTAVTGQAPFVGRGAELDELRGAFEEVARGAALTVIVEGESGVGKSATVRKFTKALEETGDVVVLAGRCYERESVPYKAVDGLIDALSNHLCLLPVVECAALLPAGVVALARTFPVLQRVSQAADDGSSPSATAQESRTMLFAALRELLTNLARARPLILVIDDLQWADGDSLLLLGEVLRPPSPPPLLLVATARPRELSLSKAEASPFGLPGDVRVLPIRRLDLAAALELVTLLAGELSATVARRIAQEAAGHPLFLDELVRHAQDSGGITAEGLHLDGALVARVGRLDPDPRALLELVCVAGTAIPQELLMRAAGVDAADLAKHEQTLRAAHLVRTHGARVEDAIEPFHDRVREAVVGTLDVEARRQKHARLAVALEGARTRDASALSAQWLGAGDRAKAGAYARQAAEEALEALAFDHAADLFARALATATLTADEAQELRVKLAGTLANAGRGTEAARSYLEAASATVEERALDLRRRAAEELLSAGRVDEGNAVLGQVLRAVGVAYPGSGLAALLGLLLYRAALFLRGVSFEERTEAEIDPRARMRVDVCNGVGAVLNALDTIRGAYFQTRATFAALRLGDALRFANALAVEGAYVAAGGPRHRARSAKLLARAGAIAERSSDMELRARVESGRGYADFFQARFTESLACQDRALQILRQHCPGAFWTMRTAQHGAIWDVGWMGELSALAVRVEQGVREAEQRGDIYGRTTLCTGVPNLVWLRLGDPGAARAIALDGTRQWTQQGYHSQHYWSLLALARVELYEGDGRSAHARVARDWSSISRAMILQVHVMAIEALHLRASTALAVAADARGSERHRMIRAAERDARRIAGRGDALATAYAGLVRAGAEALRGDRGRAFTTLEGAALGFSGLSMALNAAVARWHMGRLVGGDAGRQLVASGEAFMTSQGVASPARMAAMLAPGFPR